MVRLLPKNPRQASLTREILLRDVKLFSYFISQCLQANGFVHILLINLNDRCRGFFLCDTFPTVLTNLAFLHKTNGVHVVAILFCFSVDARC